MTMPDVPTGSQVSPVASECPTGCGREVRYGHLMCGGCWHEVPRHLQRDVLSTWRTYSKFTGIAQSDERRTARLAYQAAVDAAIGSVP